MSVSEPSRSYSSFMFEGKERLRADGINEYDQGARRYAAAFPFFTTPDRKASSTPWLSPYSFCASNPINAVDPSGNRTFFISGMHYHDGGNPVYWGGLDKMVMKEVGDPKATYLDGSTGGVLGAYGVMGNFNVWARQIKGFALGVMMAPHLRKVLDKDEKIRFVSHSMGGAFTKGLIFGMSSVLGDKFTERVEFEIDLAPYQARNQKAVPNIQTYTIQHKDDQWAGTKEIEGATSVKSVTKDENGKAIVDHGVGGHGVASFILELQKFLQKRNNK